MGKLADTPESCQRVAEVLKALGHPLRIRIVALLCREEPTVGQLTEHLGVSQPSVSQQLRILRMQGLVTVRREEGYAYYALAEPRLEKLVKCMEGCSFC